MKREYKKPDILIEDFSLLENISMGIACEPEIHSHSRDFCHYDASGEVTQEDIDNNPDINFSNVFYSAVACAGGVIDDDHIIDCLNAFMNIFSS